MLCCAMLCYAMLCVSKEEVGAMFGEYDADGNQEISLEEFTELMQSTGIFEME